MIDYMSMVKAQQIMWVKRLTSDSKASWKAFPLWALGKIGTSILKCIPDPTRIPANLTAFYHQMVQTWAELKCQEQVQTAWDVRRQSFLFNKHILIGSQYVWNRLPRWLEKGVLFIHDIVDSKGCFLTIENLRDMYNIEVDVLTYNGVKNAIPSSWRHLLKQMTIPRNAISNAEGIYLNMANGTLIPVCLLTNNIVYTLYVQSKVTKPTCIDKWTGMMTSTWSGLTSFNYLLTQLDVRIYRCCSLRNI